LAAALACVAGATVATDGRADALGSRTPLTISIPEGALQFQVPDGWESNPRLAEENGVPAFLHPGGMTIGDNIPVWVLIERRERPIGVTFDQSVHTILLEGVPFGFVARDSLAFLTIDGRTIRSYRFNTSEEGWERGLAFLDLPGMTLLFRQHAADSSSWRAYREEIDATLRSMRFLARQTPARVLR
jgi:hypothetical protein